MDILYTTLIDLVAGIGAQSLMLGKDSGGFIIPTLPGVAGTVVAKYHGQAMQGYRSGGSAGFMASVVSVIILLRPPQGRRLAH